MANKTNYSDESTKAKGLTINFTKNLRYLMKNPKTKITSIDLAEAIGVSGELICKLKNGNLSNPSLKVLSGISNHFKVSLDDLIFSDLESNGDNDSISTELISHIPVIDFNQVSNWKNAKSSASIVMDNFPSNNRFALYIDYDYGVFPKKSFLFVDTIQKPKSNDYVVVLNNITNMVHIKRLIIEEFYYLQSVVLNLNNVVKYNEQEYLICGVVIGYQKTELF